MSERSITRKVNLRTNPWMLNVAEFPKDTDGIIYVRQSSLIQQQTNIHSFEMQTDKFLEHFRNMGCTGHIELIADDEAMSGTLDIHKRPGMTRMVKLIEAGHVGWIGAVAVNRFTRDPWLITPSVLMKLCYDHNVWIATLRMFFNFRDEYCQRVFMLEAEESARHLKWMKLVLGGAKSTASDNGYYDGRYISPGYIVDRTDPKRKRYIIYRPHADIVFWLFQRFLELDGDFAQLCREVEAMPYVFPRFADWVDPLTVSKFSLYRKNMDNRTPEGHYKLMRHGLLSILTNPVYIGWWIPLDGGVIEQHHEPIVDEVLFAYAHKRLSTYDLNGQRQKPERVSRYSKAPALLKRVVKAHDGTPIYPHSPTRTYLCLDQRGKLIPEGKFAVSIKLIDTVFLEAFFERVQSILPDQLRDWEDKIEKKRVAREAQEALIKKSLKAVTERMKRILALLTPTEEEEQEPLSGSMKNDLIREYKGLEEKKAELERQLTAEKDEEEDDDETLYEIRTLIPRIVALWDSLPIDKKLRFVGALVRQALLSRVSPGWVKLEIHWKLFGWETDIAHIRHARVGEHWTTEEEEMLRELFPTEDAGDILHAFPSRSWGGIKQKASDLRLRRVRRGANSIPVNSPDYLDMSLEDIAYAERNGLVLCTKNAQWRN